MTVKGVRALLICGFVGAWAAAASAQVGPGQGPGPGPRAAAMAASGPGAGPRAGAGPHAGMGPGVRHGHARWGHGITPGWALMSPQEREAHRQRMRAMTSHDECKSYQSQHHQQMAARAKERGGRPMAAPRRDGCAGLGK